MMKKNGFTLAEVLITLAIIGVVATLTLPALMTNTQEQQARSALKKGINTLTEAAQMNLATNGFDYASISDTTTAPTDESAVAAAAETQSLFAILSKNTTMLSVTTKRGVNDSPHSFTEYFFRDGTSIIYDPANTNAGQKPASDGLAEGFTVIYDTNGRKKPNLLSNCAGQASLATNVAYNDGEPKEGEEAVAPDCNDPHKRIIKDQFLVQLRGSYAVPQGSAATWAYNN